MADFGDETGRDVLDNITRTARMPFDEMVRIMLRKMLNGSKDFEPQYNKQGKVESIDLPFDSLRERALAMDVMKQEGIEFEKGGSKVNVQHFLKIKPEDHERFQQAMQDRLADKEVGANQDKIAVKVHQDLKGPASEKQLSSLEYGRAAGLLTDKEIVELSTGDMTKQRAHEILNNHPEIAKQFKTAAEQARSDADKQIGLEEPFNPQAYKSHDGMDPDGRTRQVEGLWKDSFKDEVNNLPDNLNIGQFANQLAERGIGVDVAKDGGYQLYDPLKPHHRINLKNLDAKYTDEKLGIKSKETAYEEKSRESRDRSANFSKERDLGEIGDKEIPSQQLITR